MIKRISSGRLTVLVGVIANVALLFALPDYSWAQVAKTYSTYSTYSEMTPILNYVLNDD